MTTRPAVINLLEELSTTPGSAVRSKRGACQVPMSLAIHGKDTVCDVAVEIFVRRACRRRIVVLTVGARWDS